MSIKISKTESPYSDEEKSAIQQQFDYAMSQYCEVDNLYKIAKLTALFFPYGLLATFFPIRRLMQADHSLFRYWMILPTLLVITFISANIYVWYAYFSVRSTPISDMFPFHLVIICSICLWTIGLFAQKISKVAWLIRELIYYKQVNRYNHYKRIVASRFTTSGMKGLFNKFAGRIK